MLLWVKTRILTFLDLGGKGGNSSTVTTRHVTVSQVWVENKPKTLLWHSQARNRWNVRCRTFGRKRKDIFASFLRFFFIRGTLCLFKQSLWTNASPYIDSVCSRQCRRHLDTHPFLIFVIMINKNITSWWFKSGGFQSRFGVFSRSELLLLLLLLLLLIAFI